MSEPGKFPYLSPYTLPSQPAAGPSRSGQPPKKPLEPLTGFRASLEHTGLPRGLLTWKPRLPGRNWLIFWTVVGSLSYIYYDDRKKCKQIKEAYLDKVRYLGQQPLAGSLDMPRKVKVYGAKWAEDDETDRALKYFRKYVKPYLVAAGIDYEQVTSPLHGSITRQVQAAILKRRRQALGLEEREIPLQLPVVLNTGSEEQREVEGGVVLVGRASLKEYLEGLKRGWSGGVGPWEWEKEIEEKIQYDGVFEDPPPPADASPASDADATGTSAPTPAPAAPSPALGGALGFLSRPPPPRPPVPTADGTPAPVAIRPEWHIAPNPLPPTPPVLLLPFTNHLGFKQTPWMIFDFFTEHRRVQRGADAAMALIFSETRPFVGPTCTTSEVDLFEGANPNFGGPSTTREVADTEWDKASEGWYYKSFADLPARIKKAREDYYDTLKEKITAARQYVKGERQMTDAEKKAGKVQVEYDLKEERKKRELRWFGNLEGYEIVRPDKDCAWDERFDGWLKVYTTPAEARKEEALWTAS